MTNLDLFPETQGLAISTVTAWTGTRRDEYGHPISVLRLIPSWSPQKGWTCGWFLQIGRAVDEWHPNNPNKHKELQHYPWHRPEQMATSKTLAIAAAIATRAANIVLEQMLPYALDANHAAEIKIVQETAEARARHWLCEES